MNKIFLSAFLTGTILIVSCGHASDPIATKKAELQKLRDAQSDLSKKIQTAEDELSRLDTSSAKKEKTKLVAVQAIAPMSFTHFIDLQGKIDALNIAYVTPRNGAGGQVKGVYVKKGDVVKKGQLLLKLDDALLQQQLLQAKQQLSFAQNLYGRRKNLWADKIGTEVELVTAKNQVDQAQRQVDIVNQQIDLTNVYADISGIADDVNIRLGEFFTGNNQIKIVNTSNLKAVAQVPENYLSKIKVGSNVKVIVPELNNKTIQTKVSVAGNLIDPSTRSFYIESKLPYERGFYPNQVALVRIQDYTAENAITIPVNTLQNDDKGQYVMVAEKEGDRMVARKKPVTIGQMYEDKIEIKSGVKEGDSIVTDGYQGLYDGQPITTQVL
ncbi:MAG: efflux RND transporter periplasmic adaptor subunit [Bacteroidota bacterium]|nr:efflux RND transporter periplasmic adaptor subunit [Bacteroidota bacterium]MDP4212138.1 efflux RND transporter periplasmic adaptor subunit [Bacteroidota bacterium]MDP4249046.1 efflux RND transporter periplasmic adaptor subunit [Bacteroidota bacterium]